MTIPPLCELSQVLRRLPTRHGRPTEGHPFPSAFQGGIESSIPTQFKMRLIRKKELCYFLY
jgi:hypothetical protein